MSSKAEKKTIDFKSLILILVPSVFLYAALLFLSFVFLKEGEMIISEVLVAVVILSIVVQIIYTKQIVSRYGNVNIKTLEKTRFLLKEQEQIGKMLIRRDLELTRANEELKKLDKRKSEFVAVVAHQLRTPLSGIKWTISMVLNKEMKDEKEQDSFLKKAYNSNDRMIRLVNDMLLTERIASINEKYEFTPVQLSILLDEVLFEILPQINKRKGSIHVNKPEKELPKVKADSTKVRAVLQNFLENAVKYIKNDGKIIVELKVIDKFVQCSIKDDGIGIPLDQQANIFTRFFRGRNAIAMSPDGSGLGLFIVRSIVESHGGKAWFESKENEGTTFYFTLPIF